jgi:AcrR family transcriptional regulator
MSVDETSDRITQAAVKILLERGVKQSSVADIAYEAGVTRVTIYRYFGDKQRLVAAVCHHLAAIFERAAEVGAGDDTAQIDARLRVMIEELSRLPTDTLLVRLEEMRRYYPDAYEAFRAARQSALDRIFDQAVAAAVRDDTLRPGINLQVAKAMFWASVIGLIENPEFIAATIPHAEICATMTAILRHGMLKGGAAATGEVEHEVR